MDPSSDGLIAIEKYAIAAIREEQEYETDPELCGSHPHRLEIRG